jgi:hypothetical protein
MAVNRLVAGAAAAVLIVGGGAAYWWSREPRTSGVVPITRDASSSSGTAASDGAAQIARESPPLQTIPPAEPLPALPESDEYLRRRLADLAGPEWLDRVAAEQVARRFVATIDGLARDGVPIETRAFRAVPGTLVVEGPEARPTLAPANGERYEPYVRALEALSAPAAARLYRETYPLLQAAYEGLGYPQRRFNDRVVEVIEHLLATPEPAGPIRLSRPHVMYTFADPALEQRSAGQKLLLRMGSENASRVKNWLRTFRREITEPLAFVSPPA